MRDVLEGLKWTAILVGLFALNVSAGCLWAMSVRGVLK